MARRVGYTKSGGETASSSIPSPAIWNQMPMEDIILHNRGKHYYNDFSAADTYVSGTTNAGVMPYGDTGVTIKGMATEANGVLQIAGADAANDEGSIQVNGAGVFGVISSSSGKKLAFEVAVRPASAAVTDTAMFVGLAEEASAVGDILVDDTGVLKTTADFLGFRTLVASPSEIDAVYQKASQTPVEVDDNIATAAVDTWVKLGYVFDPDNTDKQHKYYVNGVEVASSTSAVTDDATFPDGEEVSLLVAFKKGDASSTTEKKFDIGFVKIAQVY